jgi:adhesin/invasin
MHAEQRLEARAVGGNGATLASVTILATAGPAAPALLQIIPPTQGANTYPGARVRDQFGNPVPGVTVTFTVTAGGGTVEGATVITGSTGEAYVGRWNLGAPGANTIQASSGTLTPVTYTIMQQSRVPARIVLSAGQDQTAMVGTNVPIPPSVIVQNDVGTPLSDIVVTFTPGPNSGNVTTTTVTTGQNGMATLGGWFLGNVVGAQTLVASAGTATFTFNATGTPARVGSLATFAGDAQIAAPGSAVPIPPAVKVLDVHGNAVPNVPVTFSVYNGLGSITGENAMSNSAGIATVGSWTLGPIAGTQTLRATAEGASDLYITAQAATGNAALIKPHPDNPTSALLRTEITLSVIVVDDIDRPKAGVPVNFAPITSHFGQGMIVSQSQNVMTNAQGVASVRYIMPDNVYAPGGVYADVSGLTRLQINVTPQVGPPSEIRVTLSETPVVAGGNLGQPMFSVVDAHGNAIPFYPVTFTVTAGGGTLDGATERVVSTAPPPATTTSGPMWKSGPVAGANTIVISAENVPSVTLTRTTVTPP